MDLQNQQRIKDAAEKFGAENVVVILGSSDAEGAESHRPPPKVGAWFYEPLKAVENLEPPKGGYSSSLN